MNARPNLHPNRSRADGRLPELRLEYYRISASYRPGSAWDGLSLAGSWGSLVRSWRNR